MFIIIICKSRLPDDQIDALKDIHYNLNGDHWSNCTWNWTLLAIQDELPPKYCGLYIGVNYHYNESENYQTVWALVFHQIYNISGYLHPNIELLQDIEEIYIDSAPLLAGSIPNTICNLPLLFYISFKDTNLTGFVPECIGYSLPKLKKIQFQGNPYLSFNSSILESICNNSLQMLQIIVDIDYYGSFPNCIGNKLLHLQWIDFAPTSNNFKGTLPSSLNNLTKLQSLTLRSPNLSGTISPLLLQNNPSLNALFIANTSLKTIDDHHLDLFVNALCNLSNLTTIQFADNRFLDFYIPECISNLDRLIAFDFSLLSRQIPWPSLCGLPNLFRIKITNSSIQQNEIPRCFTNMTKQIVYVVLGGFHHVLPPIISPKLKLLDLGNSTFDGKLSDIFINEKYPDFEILVAHSNHFSDDNIDGLLNKLLKYSPNLQAISIYNNTFLSGKFPEFSGDVYLPHFKILAAQNLDIYGILPDKLYLGDTAKNVSSLLMLYNNRLSSNIPQNLIQSTNNTHSSLILQGNLFQIGSTKDDPVWLQNSPFIEAHNLYLTDFDATVHGLMTIMSFICAILALSCIIFKRKVWDMNTVFVDILFLENMEQIIEILVNWKILILLSGLCLFYPWFYNYYVSSPWL